MNKYYLLLLTTALILTLTACSDDGASNTNNGASNNGNNGTADLGVDTGDDASPDASEETLSVLSIQPASGPMSGDTPVSISGTGFVDGATVHFGDTEAATTTFVSKFQLDVTSPTGSAPGTVDIVVENPDGEQATLSDSFEYTADAIALSIGWCTLQHPDQTTTTVDTETEGIFGRVFVEGCSEAGNECQQVQGELGFGNSADDPSADSSTWTWTAAGYNDGHTADDNDEYSATLTPDTAGTYAYAYRFSIDGTNWTYCDLDGSDNGFDAAQAGELTVEQDTPMPSASIDWCRIQWPESTTTTAGTDTESIYGRVYSDGCTDGAARCAMLSAQVGVGPETGDPTTDASAYTWVEATYNAGHTADNNDEYQATLSPPAQGTYSYAYRFSGDGGTTWTYCDFDDADGFQAANMGTLTVE